MALTGFSSGPNVIRLSSAVLSSPPITMLGRCLVGSTVTIGIVGIFNSAVSAGNLNLMSLIIDGGGRVNARQADGTGGVQAVDPNVAPSTGWVHCGAVFETDSLRKAYTQGVLTATNNTSRSPLSGANRTSIGGRDNAAAWQGNSAPIADVAIWSVVLTDEEIMAHAQGFPASKIRPESLVWDTPLVRDVINIKGDNPSIIGSLSVFDHPPGYGVSA